LERCVSLLAIRTVAMADSRHGLNRVRVLAADTLETSVRAVGNVRRALTFPICTEHCTTRVKWPLIAQPLQAPSEAPRTRSPHRSERSLSGIQQPGFAPKCRYLAA